jgi:multidrug efflux pump subunit AcrA (membrane-fusion protein)
VDNAGDKLRSGQLMTAEVIWQNSAGLLVPAETVSMLAGQAFVFVAKDNGHGQLIAKQVSVEPGEMIGDNYHILTGLHHGDKIVASGLQNLVDGAPIAGKE